MTFILLIITYTKTYKNASKKNFIGKDYHSKPKLGVVKKYQKKKNQV